MIKKRLVLILTIITILLCIETVNAEEITIKVDSKHLIGMGSGNTPFDNNNWINVVYVISERNMTGMQDNYIVQEYPVSIQDYYKIKIGQKVTLKVPDSRTKVCEVVKIE